MVTAKSKGRPSKGEADTLACARRFVGYFRSRGETWWGEPAEVSTKDRAWLDCEARDLRNPKAKGLRMQVQRAVVGDKRYRDWGQKGETGLPGGATPDELAAVLIEAIKNKALAASPDVVLLLDAARLPWLALEDVAKAARGCTPLLPRRSGPRRST